MSGPLEGKVAVVTGGASGIGLASARRLAEAGADVLVADINGGAAEKAAADLGGRSRQMDVTLLDEWRSLVADEERIDIAHLNAGVVTGGFDGIDGLTDDAYHRIMAVNVDGVVNGFRILGESMAGSGGDIVVTASIAGIIPFPQDPIYTATKHFVLGLSRSVAPLFAGKGIRVNAICPGIVETPLLGKETLAMLRNVGFPLIQPPEVAEAVFEAVTSGRSGEAWVIQPGVLERYQFGHVPGPNVEGAEGKKPPLRTAE